MSRAETFKCLDHSDDNYFMKRTLLTALIALTFGLAACSRKAETTRISIQLPGVKSEQAKPQSFKVATYSYADSEDTSTWSGEISAGSEVNCYGIMVGGPEPELKTNSCSSKANGAEIVRFGPYVGGVPAGQTISIEVKSGVSRRITLIAMKAESGYCTDFHGSGPTEGKISHPRVIATQTLDLSPGARALSFTVPSNLSSLSQIDDCDVTDMPPQNSGERVPPWSNGRDGSILTLTNINYLDKDDAYSSLAGATHTAAAGGTPSSKVFGYSSRVTSINLSSPNVLTVATAPTTSEHLQPGDVVLLHVNSAWASSNSDTTACATDWPRGRWRMATVAAVASSQVTLTKPVTEFPTSVTNAHYSATIAESTPHCAMQLVRVSHFDTITLGTGHALNFTAPEWNSSTNVGGVIAVSVGNLILGAGSTLQISMLGIGHSSSANGAFGLGGYGTGSTSYLNRPGKIASEGGGGGSAGAGGTSGSYMAPGGSSFRPCGTNGASACGPFRDGRAIFGGGGSGASSLFGGGGGGFILFIAKNISGAGAVSLNVAGGNAAYTGTGGGGGGSISFIGRSLSTSSAVYLDARGGNGNTGGGGGGGGSIETAVCNSSIVGTVQQQIGAGAGGTGAGAGVTQSLNFELTDPKFCLP